MYPLAHLAASLQMNEVYHGDRLSAGAGAIVPDLIDKTLGWALGITPSGRYAAHSLAGATALTLATAWLAGPTRAASFGPSYLCHLVGDLWEGGHVPWLMPFREYNHSEGRWDLGITWRAVLLEFAGMVLLARLAARWAKEKR